MGRVKSLKIFLSRSYQVGRMEWASYLFSLPFFYCVFTETNEASFVGTRVSLRFRHFPRGFDKGKKKQRKNKKESEKFTVVLNLPCSVI